MIDYKCKPSWCGVALSGVRRFGLLFGLAVVLLACEAGDIRGRERGALGGGAVGAGLGAIVGNQFGNAGAGIAIGAAAGALAGGLIGNEVDQQDDALQVRADRINRQQQRIEENQRLIEELRRGGVDVYLTDRGVVVNLPDVLFAFDRSNLTATALRTVDEIARVIRGVPERRIAVEGHTDSVGTVAYNQRLSEARSRSVADALVTRGVSRSRVVARGYGESDPIASNGTATGRARNRRVEVIIKN